MNATTSGRSLLGAALALPAIAAAPALASPPAIDADAELLRLGAEFQRRQARYTELDRAYANVVQIPDQVTAEIAQIAPLQHDLAERVADLHATTTEGLRVKARVLLAYASYTWGGDPMWENHDELLGWSLARDLLGDAAARPAGVAA